MTQHDFTTVFSHYPELISEMPNLFTSHQFILHFAQRYQALYIESLYDYRDIPNPQHATPFKIVHGFLAKHLKAYSHLVTNVGEVESTDIFTQENRCAQWQKV